MYHDDIRYKNDILQLDISMVYIFLDISFKYCGKMQKLEKGQLNFCTKNWIGQLESQDRKIIFTKIGHFLLLLKKIKISGTFDPQIVDGLPFSTAEPPKP